MPRHALVLVLALAAFAAPAHAGSRHHRSDGYDLTIGVNRHGPWFSASYSQGWDRGRGCDRGCDDRRDCGHRRSTSCDDRRGCDDRGWSRSGYGRSCDHRGYDESITQDQWVPAPNRTVVVGYRRCGEPIYDRERVPGHWESVVIGHRCGRCGSRW